MSNPHEPVSGTSAGEARPASAGPRLKADFLSRLTIGHIVTIISAVFVSFAVIASATLWLAGSWMLSSLDDAVEWGEVQHNLNELHELVTDQYLEANHSLRSDSPTRATLEARDAAITEDIDLFRIAVVDITQDSRFGAAADLLQGASTNLTETAIAGVVQINTGEPGAREIALEELDQAFDGWRGTHETLVNAMEEIEAWELAGRSERTNTLAKAVALLSVGLIVVFIAAWYLGRQARNRERSLQRQIRDDKDLRDAVVNQLPDLISWKDDQLRLLGCNQALRDVFRAVGVEAPTGEKVSDQDLPAGFAESTAAVEAMEREVIASRQPILGRHVTVPSVTGGQATLIRSVVPLVHKERVVGVVSTTRDVTQLLELERSLAAATKLESIGQLAAGIAHEINTPVQFVSDNTTFLDDAFGSLISAVEGISAVACECDQQRIAAIRKDTDLDFLLEDIPDAVAQSREGLEQIAKIVRAMKDFAHPGGDIGPADINKLLQSVVDVSRNEWKYDAEMNVDLTEDLPQPHCDDGQIKQAVLNIIVNAAHAIADSEREKGTITVATSNDDEKVFISIGDDGIGIPDEIKPHIFERFFTTKEVGRGSGQGLAIAYDAIKSHGGRIHLDSAVGVGTTFTIELPIRPPNSAAA